MKTEDKYDRTYVLGMLDIDGSMDIARRVYDSDCLCPCLNAHGGDTVPKIIINKRKDIDDSCYSKLEGE